MEKPVIILVDPNTDFMEALEIRLIHAFGYNVQYITMNDTSYLNTSADVIVIRDELFSKLVDAKKIIISHEGDNPDTIAEEIISSLKIKEPKTIGFLSATGGSGKTTLALLCSELAAKEKSVLYLNTEYIPSHTGYLHAPDLTDQDNASKGSNLYEVIKPYLKTESFTYLPISASMPIEAYKTMLEGALQSKDYDFILVDTDTMNERTSKIIPLFDKTVLVIEQNEISIYRSNLILKDIHPDFILCNKKIGHQKGFIDALDTDISVSLIPYTANTQSLKEFDGLKNLVYQLINN